MLSCNQTKGSIFQNTVPKEFLQARYADFVTLTGVNLAYSSSVFTQSNSGEGSSHPNPYFKKAFA